MNVERQFGAHRGPAAAGLLLAAALLALPGCGQGPQVSGANRDVITSLATAVSSRDPRGLDANARLIEDRRKEGACPDAEYEVFRDVIEKAKVGDWETAETIIYAIRDAQEPTAEDQANLAARKLSADHGLSRPRAGANRPPSPR